MRIVLVSRFPRVDALAWKRTLAQRLLRRGVEVGVLYSRSTIVDQTYAGLREFGFGIVRQYLDRRSNRPSSDQTLDGWAVERGLARHHRQRLEEPETLVWLREFAPDLVILLGADIVPAALLEIPRLGTINPHYGLLPRYRGMNVTEWSIYYDDPVGVTVHAVDPGIDTGEILLHEALTVPIRRDPSLDSETAAADERAAPRARCDGTNGRRNPSNSTAARGWNPVLSDAPAPSRAGGAAPG